ncbi:MAG: HD domain-containing protein [Clostridia bacterium]|nr:HD domain-containing protein [Clostridia bacterium]MDD4386967.1 HD domain-containing protein [Clostridia bacterium]
MNICELGGKERFERIKCVQNATIKIAYEWAEILEFYIHISGKISLADVYQTYKRIIIKVEGEITEEKVECLELMKRAITILLDVWKYKESLLEVINEVNLKFEPIMGGCNKTFLEMFYNMHFSKINYKIDVMIILFESDLKIEYKGDLQKELSDIYTQTVNTLISIIDIKDPYTRGHSERVSILAEKFGRTLDLSQTILEELVIASKLHDIGKIGISETILTKKCFLSVEEYNIIKKHTELGESIVKGIPGFQNIAHIIKYHHERYDGKGYYNLSSSKISQSIYIICLCDSFDTMNSDRSYRAYLDFESIIKEFENCSSTQFEPVLCHRFIFFLLENNKDIQKIYSK